MIRMRRRSCCTFRGRDGCHHRHRNDSSRVGRGCGAPKVRDGQATDGRDDDGFRIRRGVDVDPTAAPHDAAGAVSDGGVEMMEEEPPAKRSRRLGLNVATKSVGSASRRRCGGCGGGSHGDTSTDRQGGGPVDGSNATATGRCEAISLKHGEAADVRWETGATEWLPSGDITWRVIKLDEDIGRPPSEEEAAARLDRRCDPRILPALVASSVSARLSRRRRVACSRFSVVVRVLLLAAICSTDGGGAFDGGAKTILCVGAYGGGLAIAGRRQLQQQGGSPMQRYASFSSSSSPWAGGDHHRPNRHLRDASAPSAAPPPPRSVRRATRPMGAFARSAGLDDYSGGSFLRRVYVHHGSGRPPASASRGGATTPRRSGRVVHPSLFPLSAAVEEGDTANAGDNDNDNDDGSSEGGRSTDAAPPSSSPPSSAAEYRFSSILPPPLSPRDYRQHRSGDGDRAGGGPPPPKGRKRTGGGVSAGGSRGDKIGGGGGGGPGPPSPNSAWSGGAQKRRGPGPTGRRHNRQWRQQPMTSTGGRRGAGEGGTTAPGPSSPPPSSGFSLLPPLDMDSLGGVKPPPPPPQGGGGRSARPPTSKTGGTAGVGKDRSNGGGNGNGKDGPATTAVAGRGGKATTTITTTAGGKKAKTTTNTTDDAPGDDSFSSTSSQLEGVLPVSELFYRSTQSISSTDDGVDVDGAPVVGAEESDRRGRGDGGEGGASSKFVPRGARRGGVGGRESRRPRGATSRGEDDDEDMASDEEHDDEELPFSAEQSDRLSTGGVNKVRIRRNRAAGAGTGTDPPTHDREGGPSQSTASTSRGGGRKRRAGAATAATAATAFPQARGAGGRSSKKMVRRGMEMLVGGEPINADPPLRSIDVRYDGDATDWAHVISTSSRDFGPLLHTSSIPLVPALSRSIYCEFFVSNCIKWKICPREFRTLVMDFEHEQRQQNARLNNRSRSNEEMATFNGESSFVDGKVGKVSYVNDPADRVFVSPTQTMTAKADVATSATSGDNGTNDSNGSLEGGIDAVNPRAAGGVEEIGDNDEDYFNKSSEGGGVDKAASSHSVNDGQTRGRGFGKDAGSNKHAKRKKRRKYLDDDETHRHRESTLSTSALVRDGNDNDDDVLEGGELKFSLGIGKQDLESGDGGGCRVLRRVLQRGVGRAIEADDLGYEVRISRLSLLEVDGTVEVSVQFNLSTKHNKRGHILLREAKQINHALSEAVDSDAMVLAIAASTREETSWSANLRNRVVEELLFETEDIVDIPDGDTTPIQTLEDSENDAEEKKEDEYVVINEETVVGDNEALDSSVNHVDADGEMLYQKDQRDESEAETDNRSVQVEPLSILKSTDITDSSANLDILSSQGDKIKDAASSPADDLFLNVDSGGVFYNCSMNNLHGSPYGGSLGPLFVDAMTARAEQRQPRVIAIGDVHGCLDELQALLRRCDYRPGDLVVFLGDLVSKGPDSLGVVQMAREIGAIGVRGNHDFEVIRWHQAIMSGADPPVIGSEHFHIASGLGKADLKWLYNLPWYLSSKELGALFVHAGFVSGIRLSKQNPRLMMNMRSILPDGTVTSKFFNNWPWARLWDGPQTVLFGHDADRGLQQYEHAIGLDTGCVYGGRLTACILPEKRLVSVSAKREYFQYRRKHFD